MTADSAADRDRLREHLVSTRIAGQVATTRENNLENYGRMLRRDPEYTFGLTPARDYTPDEVLAVMARMVGVSPDPAYRTGVDTIDPDLTIAALDVMAEWLGKAMTDRSRVLLATGHPTGVLAIHLAVAQALVDAGCVLLRPGHDEVCGPGFVPGVERRIRYLGGVGMVRHGGDLMHTHLPDPMRVALDALARAGDQPPDLVVADHGWAGAAAEAGLVSLGFADCNDPALFVGQAEGTVTVAVPLDDNVRPDYYDPVSAYLLARARG